MRADLSRVTRLLAVVARRGAAGCSGGEPVRIGLLTDCRGLFSGYEDEMLAGAELPLLERVPVSRTGSRPAVSPRPGLPAATSSCRGCTEASEFTILVEEARRLVEVEGVDAVVGQASRTRSCSASLPASTQR